MLDLEPSLEMYDVSYGLLTDGWIDGDSLDKNLSISEDDDYAYIVQHEDYALVVCPYSYSFVGTSDMFASYMLNVPLLKWSFITFWSSPGIEFFMFFSN